MGWDRLHRQLMGVVVPIWQHRWAGFKLAALWMLWDSYLGGVSPRESDELTSMAVNVVGDGFCH